MPNNIRIQDLTSDKIVDRLARADIHVTDEQTVAIEHFVRTAGGLDQTCYAVESLAELGPYGSPSVWVNSQRRERRGSALGLAMP
jgi:hypothetical protein